MINLYRRTSDFKNYINGFDSHHIGLVPTMGNLHSGHLSLIKECLSNHEVTIVTIFVNPKQFSKGEDLDSYPRTLDQDLNLIGSLARIFTNKKIAVFAPSDPSQIYPDGFSSTISVEGNIAEILCAKSRPDHFKGVTTVVYKLFQLSKAGHAYFGQKDFQQFKILEKMTHDLELNINLTMMPIVREESGLALSSRNQYLTDDQRNKSLRLRKTINQVKDLITQNKVKEAQVFCQNLEKEDFEYLQIKNSKNLNQINDTTTDFVILGCLNIGLTRLIDNQMVNINA